LLVPRPSPPTPQRQHQPEATDPGTLYRYFNHIRVRSFILSGAPFANKTANPGHEAALGQNRLFQHVLSTQYADHPVVDLDAIDDGTDPDLSGGRVASDKPLAHRCAEAFRGLN